MADLKVYDVFDMSPLSDYMRQEGELRTLMRGVHFCNIGVCAQNMGLVKSGAFAFMRPDYKGNNQTCSLAFAGEIIGAYVSTVLGRSSELDVVALCRSEVYVIPVDAVINYMDRELKPGYRTDFTHAVAYGLMMRAISSRCDSVEARYRELLTRVPDLNKHMSNAAITSYLGISREAFARMRAKMRN